MSAAWREPRRGGIPVDNKPPERNKTQVGSTRQASFSYDKYGPDYEQKGCDNHEETNLLSLAK